MPKRGTKKVWEENKKKSRLLNGSLDFTGTKAFGTYMEFASLSAANVYTYTLKVNEPPAPGMTIRMAYGIPGRGSAAAAITELGHFCFPPYALEHPTCALYHSI